MALPKHMKTQHGGAKNSSAKHGWWGPRSEAKRFARKARRRIDKLLVEFEGDVTPAALHGAQVVPAGPANV